MIVAEQKNEKALTATQVCQRLSIDKKTLYKLIARGKLEAFKVGRDWRVFPSELEAYVARESNG